MQAKLVALKLAKLGLVEDMYTFDNWISPKLSKMEMINTDSGGGTSINAVTEQINRLNRPSVVITDAEDSAGIHTNKAYFIGVPGARFTNGWGSSSWKPYVANRQCSLMNSDGTLEVVTDKSKKDEW